MMRTPFRQNSPRSPLRRCRSFRLRPDVPHLFLVTDGIRLPDPLPAAERLPRGAGVIFRHYGHPDTDRARLLDRLNTLCRRCGLILLHAGSTVPPSGCGVHLPEPALRGGRLAPLMLWRRQGAGRFALLTAATHGRPALLAARRLGCDAVLLSPAFATASHPGTHPLGPVRWALLRRRLDMPVIALGGMTPLTLRRLSPACPAGMAAIGALKAPTP